MAELPIQFPNGPGFTFQAADAAGDSFTLDTRTFAIVENTDVAPHAVTLQKFKATTRKQGWGELDVPDRVVTIPAGDLTVIHGAAIPFAADGKANLSYDDVTGMQVAVCRLVDVD